MSSWLATGRVGHFQLFGFDFFKLTILIDFTGSFFRWDVIHWQIATMIPVCHKILPSWCYLPCHWRQWNEPTRLPGASNRSCMAWTSNGRSGASHLSFVGFSDWSLREAGCHSRQNGGDFIAGNVSRGEIYQKKRRQKTQAELSAPKMCLKKRSVGILG